MPIINMVHSEAEARAIPGAVNIRKLEGYGPNTENMWLYDTHVGLCIQDFERNGYDDSDFYMKVWNPEAKKPETVMFATTRGWTYPCMGSHPDATPEVLQEYEAYCQVQREAEKQRMAELEAANPTIGKEVNVIKGRKHKGKSGRVFWRGANRFRTYYRNGYNKPEDPENQVLGVETTEGERFFVPANQTQVVGATLNSCQAISAININAKFNF